MSGQIGEMKKFLSVPGIDPLFLGCAVRGLVATCIVCNDSVPNERARQLLLYIASQIETVARISFDFLLHTVNKFLFNERVFLYSHVCTAF